MKWIHDWTVQGHRWLYAVAVLGHFGETFTGSRRHSQDVFPLGVSPRERNKALHLPETQLCRAQRGREMSSCHENIVYSAGANDLKAVRGLLHGCVTLFQTFKKSYNENFNFYRRKSLMNKFWCAKKHPAVLSVRTFPLIQGQRVVVMAVVVLRGLWEVVGVPQLVEVRVLQRQLRSGPLVSIQNQHLFQQVDGCQGRRTNTWDGGFCFIRMITSKCDCVIQKLMCWDTEPDPSVLKWWKWQSRRQRLTLSAGFWEQRCEVFSWIARKRLYIILGLFLQARDINLDMEGNAESAPRAAPTEFADIKDWAFFQRSTELL